MSTRLPSRSILYATCVLVVSIATIQRSHATFRIWEGPQPACFCSILGLDGYAYAVTGRMREGMSYLTVDTSFGDEAPEPGESIRATWSVYGPGGLILFGKSTPTPYWAAFPLPADRMVRYVHTRGGGWGHEHTFEEGCQHARPVQEVLDFYVSIEFDPTACYAKVHKALDIPKPDTEPYGGCGAGPRDYSQWLIFVTVLGLIRRRRARAW